MKRYVLLIALASLMLFSSCQKINLFGHKRRSLLFRTDMRMFDLFTNKFSDSTGIVDSINDNVDCYYIKWDESNRKELVMRYNTQSNSNKVYGVIKGLEMILNFSEIYSDSSIYVLSGQGDQIYKFDIPSKQTSIIHIPSMNFIAGLYDKNTFVTLKWNDDSKQEEVYFVNNQGSATLIGTIDSLQAIANAQVSLWDKKVYVLGIGTGNIEEKQIYIFDVKSKKTQIIHVKHADFIAGLYHGNIITLCWNKAEDNEHVYSIAPDGKETDLGVIDGLKLIVNAAVTLVQNRVFVLGSNGGETKRIYVFDVD